MIVSVGIDIVEVYRIDEALARTPRFAARVFTAAERDYCDAKGRSRAASYAGRFAAKEAFLKAIRTGWRGALRWHDVEVINDEFGAPELVITGEAKLRLEALGVSRALVSISHTAEHAVAQVVLDKD